MADFTSKVLFLASYIFTPDNFLLTINFDNDDSNVIVMTGPRYPSIFL